MAFVPVVADMQRHGVGYDTSVLEKLIPRMERRLLEIGKLARQAAGGREVDLSTPHKVGELLHNHLKIPPLPGSEHNKKNGGVSYSTKKEFLQQLEKRNAHPIVPLILEHRRLTHTVSVAVEMLQLAKDRLHRQQMVGADDDGGGGHHHKTATGVVRVCGQFIHIGHVSGRVCMINPNLQNNPRPYSFIVKAPQGGCGGGGGGDLNDDENNNNKIELTATGGHIQYEANVRAAIVPVQPNRVMLSADYSQIELRLMAHLADDDMLRPMLADDAVDVFKHMAATWRSVAIEQVTPEMRDAVKQLVYALIYGMGAYTLAEKLNVSVEQAEEHKKGFTETFQSVSRWVESVKQEVRDKGYTTSLNGRRTYFKSINSEDYKRRGQAERTAVNCIPQGSAADVVKCAMIAIDRRLEAEGLRQHADMVLLIHDEIVLEIDSEYVDRVAVVVRECMETAVKLDGVLLRARLKVGRSWGEMQEYVCQ